MEGKNITWNQLVRYVGGESPPEEQRNVARWIHSNPEHKKIISFVRTIWEHPAEEKQNWDVDAAWQRFQAEYGDKMLLEKQSPLKPITQKTKGRKGKWVHSRGPLLVPGLLRWGAVAAAIGVIMAIVLFSYQPPSGVHEKHPVKEIVTKNGQRTYLRLSDGSHVVLNAGSSIKVPETFSGSERRVELSGEAYFEVTHNPQRPFIVYTKRATTRVLGTKFDVKAYPGDTPVQVVVQKGKVELRPRHPSSGSGTGAMITQLQRGVLARNKTTVTPINDIAQYVGWTEGKLVFDNDSIAKVAADMQRWYNVTIKLKGRDIKDLHFTGRFTTRQPLEEVLDAIALSLNISYSKKDSVIIFHNKNIN